GCGGARRPQAGRDLRRPGPARRRVPRAGYRPLRDPGRRAHRQPGPRQRRGRAGRTDPGHQPWPRRRRRPDRRHRHARPVRPGARRRGAGAVRLLVLLWEALSTTWANKVSTALVALLVAIMCATTLATVGRTAAAEQQVAERLDAAGS